MKKLFATLLATSFLCATTSYAQTAASAIDSKKQTLYSSTAHSGTPYRIPAIATLNNGTILAISDQRPCGKDVGNGEVDIYAKIGTINPDGKYTWTPSSNDPSEDGGLKIADGTSSNGYGDAAVVVDRESGKVLVICVAGKVVFTDGSSSNHNKMARIVGSADGLTWSTPQDVTTAFFDNLLPNAYTMFMASGRMIQSNKVKVGNYYRIYGALLVRESGQNHNNYVVYSDDFGETWDILGGAKACGGKYSTISFLAGNYADEAKVEELPNGDIVISSRTSGGRYYNVYNSTNGSWGSAKKCSFAGSNSTNGELMFYKGLVGTDGIEYNVLLQSLPTGSSRSNVAVYYKAFAADKSSWAVSDFTSGWTKGIEVDDGASAYSTMTILPNGQIGFIYEDDYNTSDASGGYSNIVYVPLTVKEITNGKFSELTLDEKQTVTSEINETIGNITVKRTIKPNTWSTFVVPFDIPATMLGGWEIKELTGSELIGETIMLSFSDAADGIKAGVPYMVRNTSMTEALTTISMTNVNVNTTELKNVTTDHVTFVGTYTNRYVPEGAYFISGNKFYRAADATNTLKGYRAYFTINDSEVKVKNLGYTFDEDATGVESVTTVKPEVVAVYGIDGSLREKVSKGLNIVKMSDGTTKKVYVK